MTIPEIIIHNACESIINYIRNDFNSKKDEDTILYKLLGVDDEGKPLKMNAYKYFNNAKKIFLGKQNLSVNFGFNWETAKIISLHIILPSESPSNGSIGEDEGYGEEIVDDKLQQPLCQLFDSTYQIMITSDNSNEVNIVYHVMKAMLISIIPHLSIMGLLNPKLSGNDIMFKDDLMPNGRFQRVINLSFTYELIVPQIVLKDIAKNLHFDGHPLENIKDECTFEDNE